MKITIDIEYNERTYMGKHESYTWNIKVPKRYVVGGFSTKGWSWEFDEALKAARDAVTTIHEFNEKKHKFPYVEEYTP